MEHSDAKQLGAVERYLLQELPPEQRDQFEEHFFDCLECAADLRTTSAFMEAARKELAERPATELKAAGNLLPVKSSRRSRLLQWPAILAGALAASLLVVGYQNVVVYPKMESQLARLEAPEVLPAVSLVGGNSRGGAAPSVSVGGSEPLLISFDIPTQPQYASYTCLLYGPSGTLDWRMQVSSLLANDTVTISAPGKDRVAGLYTLVVQGVAGSSPAEAGAAKAGQPAAGVELARYRFHLEMKSGSGDRK